MHTWPDGSQKIVSELLPKAITSGGQSSKKRKRESLSIPLLVLLDAVSILSENMSSCVRSLLVIQIVKAKTINNYKWPAKGT